MRNRPLKRTTTNTAAVINTTTDTKIKHDRWVYDDLPETVHQSSDRNSNNNKNDNERKMKNKFLLWQQNKIRYWFGSFSRHFRRRTRFTRRFVIIFLCFTIFVVVVLFLQLDYHKTTIQRRISIATRSNSNNNRRRKGIEVSSLTVGVNIVMPKYFASQNVSFVPLEEFGPHRRRSSRSRSFGGLDIRFLFDLQKRHQRREIYLDLDSERGYTELKSIYPDDDDYHDYYYSFDDDSKRNPVNAWNDDKIRANKKCRRVSWYREVPLNCNQFHEYDLLQSITDGNSKYTGRGAYREVYRTDLDEGVSVVLKSFLLNSQFSYEEYEFMRMDALITEKLSSNKRVVTGYGFCAVAMIAAAMAHGDLERVAVPKSGRLKVEASTNQQLVVHNNLTPHQKLKYALEMVEEVAYLHGYANGVIVHDDIQPSQFLLDESDNLLLNDFNRAEIMFWDGNKNEYCRYRNNPGHGDWRSPEEYKDLPLDEKIDIWSLGNNMYSLLTGLYPFYLIHNTEEIQKRIVAGETASIDMRFHNRSFAEHKLASFIPLCWEYDPKKRIDIFQLVKILREAYQEHIQLNPFYKTS